MASSRGGSDDFRESREVRRDETEVDSVESCDAEVMRVRWLREARD
jgi:hypothetical protein